MVELGFLPLRLGVAIAAFFTEASLVALFVIVLAMTGSAIRRCFSPVKRSGMAA